MLIPFIDQMGNDRMTYHSYPPIPTYCTLLYRCTAGSGVGVWLCETTATLHRAQGTLYIIYAQTWIVVFSQTEGVVWLDATSIVALSMHILTCSMHARSNSQHASASEYKHIQLVRTQDEGMCADDAHRPSRCSQELQ